MAMRRILRAAAILGLAGAARAGEAVASASDAYPGDAGPAAIDVSSYPAAMRADYKLFAARCALCHTLARPINAPFVELSVHEQGLARMSEPELYADPRLARVGEDVWKGYLKRMTARKGSPVTWAEGRRIWRFLVYDSARRKTGAGGRAWRELRLKLVEDFRRDQPERYRLLFGGPAPPATKGPP